MTQEEVMVHPVAWAAMVVEEVVVAMVEVEVEEDMVVEEVVVVPKSNHLPVPRS